MAAPVRTLLVGVVAVAVVGTAGAVTVDSFPQQLVLSTSEIANDNGVSVDKHRALYNGTDVGGYNVTVRNDASVNMNANVTVRLKTTDGSVVDSASKEASVLTGESVSIDVWFATPHGLDTFAWVEVEVTTTTL